MGYCLCICRFRYVHENVPALFLFFSSQPLLLPCNILVCPSSSHALWFVLLPPMPFGLSFFLPCPKRLVRLRFGALQASLLLLTSNNSVLSSPFLPSPSLSLSSPSLYPRCRPTLSLSPHPLYVSPFFVTLSLSVFLPFSPPPSISLPSFSPPPPPLSSVLPFSLPPSISLPSFSPPPPPLSSVLPFSPPPSISLPSFSPPPPPPLLCPAFLASPLYLSPFFFTSPPPSPLSCLSRFPPLSLSLLFHPPPPLLCPAFLASPLYLSPFFFTSPPPLLCPAFLASPLYLSPFFFTSPPSPLSCLSRLPPLSLSLLFHLPPPPLSSVLPFSPPPSISLPSFSPPPPPPLLCPAFLASPLYLSCLHPTVTNPTSPPLCPFFPLFFFVWTFYNASLLQTYIHGAPEGMRQWYSQYFISHKHGMNEDTGKREVDESIISLQKTKKKQKQKSL